jgi:hypothetical protein
MTKETDLKKICKNCKWSEKLKSNFIGQERFLCSLISPEPRTYDNCPHWQPKKPLPNRGGKPNKETLTNKNMYEEREICLCASEIKKAYKEITRAEKAGFAFCEAVFSIRQGWNSHWITGDYIELLEKAHPTDGHLDWGRGQNMTKRYKFKNGKLVPNKS